MRYKSRRKAQTTLAGVEGSILVCLLCLVVMVLALLVLLGVER